MVINAMYFEEMDLGILINPSEAAKNDICRRLAPMNHFRSYPRRTFIKNSFFLNGNPVTQYYPLQMS